MGWAAFKKSRLANGLAVAFLLFVAAVAFFAWNEGRPVSGERREASRDAELRVDAARLLRVAATLPRKAGEPPPSMDAMLEAGASGGSVTDPWSRPYLLEDDGAGALRVRSPGPDGAPGTADDRVIGAEVLAELPE